MSVINKIKIGENEYNITPSIGEGLQFGTDLENSHVVYINIGKAKSDNGSLPEPGLTIDHMGFRIECDKLKAFLTAMGFKSE